MAEAIVTIDIVGSLNMTITGLRVENAALRARVEKLEGELKYYGDHKKCCGWEVNEFGSPVLTDKCNCGLDAALAECPEG